jgi:hypothetical protein
MQSKIKKIISLSALVFVMGFIGAFLGKSLEKTKLGAKIEKTLGIKHEARRVETAQGVDCVQQEEKDNSALFVGCNGFF